MTEKAKIILMLIGFLITFILSMMISAGHPL